MPPRDGMVCLSASEGVERPAQRGASSEDVHTTGCEALTETERRRLHLATLNTRNTYTEENARTRRWFARRHRR